MMENTSDRRFELAAKMFSGNATKKEQQEMQELDKLEQDQLSAVWELTGRLEASPERLANWHESAEALKSRTASQRISKPQLLPRRPRNSMRYALKIAATAVIVSVSLFVILRSPKSTMQIVTQNGGRSTIQLPGGTEVELNSSSRLTYDNSSEATALDMTLHGEAFFQVTPGLVGFTVTTENARIEVLGTAFNVNSRAGKTVVTVERGRVAFESLATSDRVVLQQAETSTMVDGKPSQPAAADLEGALAWRRGELIFKRAPLKEVFEELERQFDTTIQVRSQAYERLTYTASFGQGYPVEEVLQKICLAFGWKLQELNGVYIIDESTQNP